MADHNEFGKKGEAIAAEYLVKKGYSILRKNWRYKQLEVDIIASLGNKLIVVEVKTRTSATWGDPSEAISKGKIRYLAEAAEAFVNFNNIDLEIRFDVIAILPKGNQWQIDHIEEAFHPIANN
jgi:putative endonuclease